MTLGITLAKLRTWAYSRWSNARLEWMRRIWGMDIASAVKISSSVKIDKTNPTGVHIGHGTLLSFNSAVLTHDFVNNKHVDTYIGSFCFIGAHVVVMPGVKVGDHCIVGAGSVVTRDVPSHSLAVGNPAKVIRSGIKTARWGILLESLSNQERFEQIPAGIGTGFKVGRGAATSPQSDDADYNGEAFNVY